MSFDLEKARAETPGCRNVLHLNNAGASLPPLAVTDRVRAHLELEAAIGPYEAADRVAAEMEGVYASVAKMLRARAQEIALVESATRAWDAVFYAMAAHFKPGDVILTGENEYVSNYLAFLQMAARRGVRIQVVPSEENGEISIFALEEEIARHGERVRLIALTHVPTNGGLVQPAARVGQVARRNGIPFLLDACQSAGQMPLDVETLGCDMLSATGRKYLRGPRGTGFLYVRQEWIERLEPVMLDMHAAEWTARERYRIRNDARRFESWECSAAARLGLGTAVEYALGWGLEAIGNRVRALAAMLRTELRTVPEVIVRDLPGSGPAAQYGIVTFTHARTGAAEIFARMREQKINVRVTSTAWTRIDMERRGLTEMVRASVHYYNSEGELERFVREVRTM